MTTGVAVMSSATAASTATATAAATARIPLFLSRNNSSATVCSTLRCRTITRTRTRARLAICCEVALKSDSSTGFDSSSSSPPEEDEELKKNLEKVGCKVKVKSPLKVYHVPKLPEVELTPDMVGVIKQYVGFWKGKYISPNYPFKVEYRIDVPDRGSVKLVVHLKEEEFEIIAE
ncbi:hypothetical protein SOVF_071800 [Spinacia oleracea]|uniref:Ferredoxin-thioredoxin reductase, variable chain, chloroplastic n=1 Tax=Spinacia oleracea TaxID=3562 RepID=FTRV_SPIOL|nr:RecName: Full=Ferredoxin-thioredoxin reductase, variable chain, chloroplastic; Short=FTR-V; AltName: Full=Ferredoxin-thioredoxin reductase subunit A; Short=FTR-A; Flags: Precursor [Spinacia oleracea]KNA18333.1 hypothetical protein SOVF_071800 [Spinacia oleracea]CAA54408.1 ferredoxin-thioredoxin reductase SU A [Spinacia oleracea]CAA55480.1 ferredoxin:thioredoxin reductase [Spinacia oleracea]